MVLGVGQPLAGGKGGAPTAVLQVPIPLRAAISLDWPAWWELCPERESNGGPLESGQDLERDHEDPVLIGELDPETHPCGMGALSCCVGKEIVNCACFEK
jgi:hypothetical protein